MLPSTNRRRVASTVLGGYSQTNQWERVCCRFPTAAWWQHTRRLLFPAFLSIHCRWLHARVCVSVSPFTKTVWTLIVLRREKRGPVYGHYDQRDRIAQHKSLACAWVQPPSESVQYDCCPIMKGKLAPPVIHDLGWWEESEIATENDYRLCIWREEEIISLKSCHYWRVSREIKKKKNF